MVKMPMSEAVVKYGSRLRIASLGAIRKKDDTFRVTHDGTHGTGVNGSIKVRDQLVCPTAGDMRQAARELQPTFVLAADVKRAHRLVKMKEDQWGFQACRSSSQSDQVWLNTVGTFGISSIAYHWSRLMGGLQRSVYYLLRKIAVFILVGRNAAEAVAVAMFFLATLGVPFAWKKCHGGTRVDWVGYCLDIQRRVLGIGDNKTRWLINWLGRTLEEDAVVLADFSAVLGRLSFAFAALEPLRPFLAPLYTWSAAVSKRCAKLSLPKAVRLVLEFLRAMLEKGHNMSQVGSRERRCVEVFRTDARAAGEEVYIGGWAVIDGKRTMDCRWFSERLTRDNAPWVFTAGEPFRVISSLEMLATLAGIVLFGLKSDVTGSITCSAATDNLGNACVMKRLLTTSFPLAAFVMEIAARLLHHSAVLRLDWTPRLQNREADALTNGDFRGFDKAKRLRFSLESFDSIIMQDMLSAGADLYEDIKSAIAKRATRVNKKQRVTPLRMRDPWQ